MEQIKSEDVITNVNDTEKVVKSFTGITWPSASWEDGSRRSAFHPYKVSINLSIH